MSLQITFVLVGTTHTGNLGAAARAIKTMGFDRLRLVDACSHRSEEALARASGAGDVLANAGIFSTLADAVADCHVVIGASARQRQIAVPLTGCREGVEALAALQQQLKREQAEQHQVAFVFGRERSGLTNDEMDMCTRLMRIPCNPDFSSLNLGSAVQVVAYECAMALQSVPMHTVASNELPAATAPTAGEGVNAVAAQNIAHIPVSGESMQYFFDHLERVMINTGFLDADNPRKLMRRVRRYFERNRPDDNEMNILRGILTATENPRPPVPDD